MKAAFRRLVRPLLELQVKRLIARKRLKVVAVGGAVGKTTTKIAIATVLAQKYRVLVHPGNFNAEIGLPLAVFELDVPGLIINPFAWLRRLIHMERTIWGDYPYDVVVLELGTDHPGEIAHFMTYLQPDVGVVTAVLAEHMENFADLDAVAAEELTLVAGSQVAVVNHDAVAAPYRHQYVDGHPRHFWYGLGKRVDYGFELATTDPMAGTTGTLLRQGVVQAKVEFRLYGEHSAAVAAGAYAVGGVLGLTDEELVAGVTAIRPVSGRMNRLIGLHDALIIDDSYNSSPDSAPAAVAALLQVDRQQYTGRRIAIMGSMNELGAGSAEYHRQVGAACTGVDLLVTVGQEANEYMGPAAVAAGLDQRKWKPADSPYAAGEFLRLMIGQGDVILAKGSQNGVFCEEAVKYLLADPDDAAQLVRQSPAWLRRKTAQFPDAPR
jgi:UDP-N-acetylmuramoyl-tripeptide--D-alanyl-D-alanine ligase